MEEGSTAERYRRFAEFEARGNSAAYERLAGRIAADGELLALLDRLEAAKRQPNLLLAAVRFHDGPIDDYGEFRSWLLRHWDQVAATMRDRRTQTNEVGRCATLLPALTRVAEESNEESTGSSEESGDGTRAAPLALIEVGASAGLCLYPDRARYSYDGAPPIGPVHGPVLLECDSGGRLSPPRALPPVAWRAGVDLHPVDLSDPTRARWLECLVWPGRPDRVERLRGAIELARAEPPELVAGDLVEHVAALVRRAPPGSTPVVFHSAVLAYVEAERRRMFVDRVRDLARESGARWVSNEGIGVLPDVSERLPATEPPAGDRGAFVLALDGEPMAYTAPHGQWIRPIAP